MGSDRETWHTPVMVEEVKRFLVTKSCRSILDCTVGTGGHAEEILSVSPKQCILIGLDLDQEALNIARRRLRRFKGKVILKKMNFANLQDAIPVRLQGKVDAVLLDCGISKLQIVTSDRGFSFDRDGDLDMRFDESTGKTAKSILRSISSQELTALIRQFGERARASRIANAIIRLRDEDRMDSTLDLARAVKAVARQRPARSLARVFLAVRSLVTNELENLTLALEALARVLSPGGRGCVISYHSVEDRVVKTSFRKFSGRCVCPPGRLICDCGRMSLLRILTPKPIVPTPEEVRDNPSARSAKMRVVEKM